MISLSENLQCFKTMKVLLSTKAYKILKNIVLIHYYVSESVANNWERYFPHEIKNANQKAKRDTWGPGAAQGSQVAWDPCAAIFS